jgi:organic hydroperoxide reductase OsmC/OhrA
MHPFPHQYRVSATAATADKEVALEGDGLPALSSAPPAEFDGPGDRWSPETLLVASVADCFVLTFRAIAAASSLPWTALSCEVHGTVDRIDRVTQFTAFDVRAHLSVPPGTDEERATRLLEKAENSCLVTNSLKARPRLEATISVVGA